MDSPLDRISEVTLRYAYWNLREELERDGDLDPIDWFLMESARITLQSMCVEEPV